MHPLTIHAQKHRLETWSAFNDRDSVSDSRPALRITPMLIRVHYDADAVIIPFTTTLYGKLQSRCSSIAPPILGP